ncbi:hypothetical protein IWW36_003755 [Coemansia brasiliensis]|uniref:Uncharacterized protein n=1 Tax=Coemansia brasiliensis TaxID=2650707 RepID=A0A9W8IDF5_9FUNG|nr:hypothetical protein IWW36_003755 [Coemansia brasiliensis]
MATPLFIKERELAFQKSATSSIPATVYRHRDSQFRVIQCQVDQPLFTLSIYVPTLPSNNKGLPHTLEHLVFCGSQRYKNRGFLDALATCNFSQGTNAWTWEDVTCYTLTTGSEQALINVLPVYLDHVLSPQLREEQFVTEVYHFDAEGKEQGVVFSEMLGYEGDEGELADMQLRQQLFLPQSTYTRSFGGLTRDIAKLTNQEIIDYHQKYYDANNLTVLVTGPFTSKFASELQLLPAEILLSRGRDSRQVIDCSPPGDEQERTAQVVFAAEADTGSVWFGWRGPPSNDTETLIAVEIMLEYLAEETSSPLSRRFVQRACPLASGVTGYIKESIPSTFFIQFDGVPYGNDDSESDDGDNSENDDYGSESDYSEVSEEDVPGLEDPDIPHLFEEGYFEALLMTELKRIYTTQFEGDDAALQRATRQFGQRLAHNMETKPDEILQSAISIDVVASHFAPERQGKFFVGSRMHIFDIIDKLSSQPVSYWLDILQTWILDARRICCVRMVPDPQQSAKLEAERKIIEQNNASSIKDKEAHSRWISDAVAANKVDLPPEVKALIPLPSAQETTTLPHQQTVLLDKGPFSAVQLLQCDTQFIDMRIYISLAQIPELLRPFLCLFQALALGSDVQLPAGVLFGDQLLKEPHKLSYAKVDQLLAELTTTRGCSVGMGAEMFVSSLIDDLFVLRLHTEPQKLVPAVRCFVQALVFAEFTHERVVTLVQNMLSDIKRIKRDGDNVLAATMARLSTSDCAGKPRWIQNHTSLFDQERVLQQVLDDANNDRLEPTLAALDRIRQIILDPSTKAFMFLCVPNHSMAGEVDDITFEWQEALRFYSPEARKRTNEQAKLENPSFTATFKSRLPNLQSPLQVHVSLKSLQASFASICIPLEMRELPDPSLKFDEDLAQLPARDFYALRLLTELLHRTDGPLYNSIRGKGYAYGAYFVLNLWTKQLGFYCVRASDVSRAILELRKMLEHMDQHWHEYVNEFEVAMARSSLVFSSIEEQSSPRSVLSMSVHSAAMGFESVKQLNRWRNAHLDAVTMDDLRRVYCEQLRRFLDSDCPTISVVLTPPDYQLLPELGLYTRRSLEEIGH